MMRRILLAVLVLWLMLPGAWGQGSGAVTEWLTTPDRVALLAREPQSIPFRSAKGLSQPRVIAVDDSRRFQTVDGFGLALTGGSAELMMAMSPEARHALIENLFGSGPDAIGISYLRVSIGSSDMNRSVYTYDDMPAGERDESLSRFSLKPDEAEVIPVLREILRVHPGIRILASPWSAPSWMKTNGAAKGGSLKLEDYGVYARYLVRYLKGMRAHGIAITAMTMQNEPLNPKNTPSMVMTSDEQDRFLKTALGPLLRKQGMKVEVILYDHNCDRPDYPISILADATAARYAAGSGFHLYGGRINAMSAVHDAFPGKNLYFTEQMIIDKPGATELAIAEPVARVVVGAMRNWSRNVLLWNLAADPQFGPHTPNGGCPVCEGAVTLDGSKVTRNLAYYTIGQIAKYVPPGSVRIASDPSERSARTAPSESSDGSESHGESGLADVAFRTPEGKHVLVVANPSQAEAQFSIVFDGRAAAATLAAGAAATYVW